MRVSSSSDRAGPGGGCDGSGAAGSAKDPKTLAAARRATFSGPSLGAVLLALALAAVARTEAQDLLRRTNLNGAAGNANLQQLQQQLSSLANIQLPPQLAALSPQQLHQLAQLRELQIQQEAAAAASGRRRDEASASALAQQQLNAAPAPIGLEATAGALPTAQPAGAQSNGQIPQPRDASAATAATATTAANSDAGDQGRAADDGSYNEAGSEMEGVAMSSGAPAPAAGATAGDASSAANSVGSSAPTFEVNWNKCPQLEPSESEKTKKTQVITKCLQAAPIPSNLTRENVEAHREQIATCALKVEGWFDDSGAYRYDKAESEIRAKRLDQPIESQVLKFHVACKEEASKKFPQDQNKLIDQVQFYQACMDYYISIVCEIEVSVDQ